MNSIIKLLRNHFLAPASPLGVRLYLTDTCNLKCKFCEIGLNNRNHVKREKKELSNAQLERIVSAMSTLHVGNIYITGGEPFLAKSFWHLLELCAKNSIVVDGITTNGSLLGSLKDEQIARLNDARVKKIIVSVDHADAAKHNDNRGREGLFSDIEAYLTSGKADRVKTDYHISTVVSNQNFRELTSLVEWVASLKKIKHINFQPVCTEPIFIDYGSKTGSKESFAIDKASLDDLNDQLDTAIRKAGELGISTTLPFLRLWLYDYFKYAGTNEFFFQKVMGGFVCSSPYNYLHINYNGDLLACTHIGPMGNIDDGDIAESWRTGAQKYKAILASGKYFKQCRDCYCDFGANFRHALVYKPIRNAGQIARLLPYYIKRYNGEAR